jgi:CheY-like chemotaxis protein
MLPRTHRLLCVGDESDLLRTRCAVLSHSGYNAHSVSPEEAEALLKTDVYDLVILSARMSEERFHRVLLVAGQTPTLVLNGFTFVRDLLNRVEEKLILPASL